MANVKDNIQLFEKYNALQGEIDNANRLISQLKRKKDNNRWMAYSLDIQDQIGDYLHKRIGEKIIVLLEAEIIELKTNQNKIEIKC